MPFVPYEDHADLGPEALPMFARVADRLDAGEEPRLAIDHLTRREANHLSRLVASSRPLEPWLRHNREIAAQSIREVCA